MRALTAALLILTAFVAAAGAEPTVWSHPGQEPFMGSCEEGIAFIPIEDTAGEIKTQICSQREAVTVSAADFEKDLNASALPDPRKSELAAKARAFAKRRLFIEDLKAIGAPSDLVAKIQASRIDARLLAQTRGVMAPNETCNWMVFTVPQTGKHRLSEQVKWKPAPDVAKTVHPAYLAPNGRDLVVYRFTATTAHFEVVAKEPAVCHNLCLERFPASLIRRRQVSTPPSPAPGPIVQADAALRRTIAIHFWSRSMSAPEAQALLDQLASVGGKQSRDIGDEILALAAAKPGEKPKAVRDPRCFEAKVIFQDAGKAALSDRIWINGKAEPFTDTVRLLSCGEWQGGFLAVPVNPPWNTNEIALTVVSPVMPPELRYPSSGNLKTCGPKNAGVCGSSVRIPTAMHDRLTKPDVTHFHFVVR